MDDLLTLEAGEHIITITNLGDETLILSTITLDDPLAEGWSITQPEATSLGHLESTTFTVTAP